MALVRHDLEAQILTLTNIEDPQFVGFPGSNEETGLNWSRVARSYFEAATFPPASAMDPLAHDLAQAAMAVALTAVLDAGGGAVGLLALRLGFEAYVFVLPTKAIPPLVGGAPAIISPPGSLVLPALPPTSNPRIPARAIAEAVDLWARTGTYQLPGVPTLPPPSPWT